MATDSSPDTAILRGRLGRLIRENTSYSIRRHFLKNRKTAGMSGFTFGNFLANFALSLCLIVVLLAHAS
jgi:hypothetical protein